MKPTTARRFGSLGRSFVAPAAAAAVIGSALIASDTSDTSETVWSPAAACLLPDVLPVAGTLLSYGGNRQLAAGGTVTHAGSFLLTTADANATLVIGNSNGPGIGATGTGLVLCFSRTNPGMYIESNSTKIPSTSFYGLTNGNWAATVDARYGRGSTGPTADICANGGARIRNFANSADAPLTAGAITASGAISSGGTVLATLAAHVQHPIGTVSIALRDDLGYGLGMNADKRIVWSSSTGTQNLFSGTIDTSISRISAGVLGVGTGAAGSVNGQLRAAGFVATGTNAAGSFEVGSGGSFYAFAGGTTRWQITETGVTGVMRLASNSATTGVCLNVGTADVVTVRNLANTGVGGLTCGTLTANSINQADPFGRLSLAGGNVKLKAQTAGLLELLNLLETAPADLSCGNIQSTPTQSALNPTTINIPSGRRQGWYNSALAEFRDWVNIGGTLLKSAAYT
jgi:hypothetical protein